MICSVDTNVILDVITDDPAFADGSEQLLSDAYDTGSLVICEVVYAELVPRLESRKALESLLARVGIKVARSGEDVAWIAGRKWAEYRSAGGSRQRILPDFFIGAHATVRADCLLTRDRGFYVTYFPELRLLSKSSGEII